MLATKCHIFASLWTRKDERKKKIELGELDVKIDVAKATNFIHVKEICLTNIVIKKHFIYQSHFLLERKLNEFNL